MISSLKGTVQEILEHALILDVQGVGYEVVAVPSLLQKIRVEDSLMLYTHLHIREDAHTLFGFSSLQERKLFRKLISVSGIGPKSAMAALSAAPMPQLVQAIHMEDYKVFDAVPGIGPKTAKRLVMELRNAIDAEEFQVESGDSNASSQRGDLISALEALGYSSKEILAHLGNRDYSSMTLQEAVRDVLKSMKSS